MKRILLLILILPVLAMAQNKPLVISGTSPDLYLTHTVAPKENYYSIGRLYNISPKEMAPYNHLQLEKGLSLNQVIKVPLTATNFSQVNEGAEDESMVPVYHVVKEKEGLYRISVNYNKLPLEVLKQWNNIKGDAVANGTKLIVGYLKVKRELSALAGGAVTVPAPPVVKETTPKTTPVKEIPKPEISNETLPVVKNPNIKPAKERVPVVTKEDKPVVEKTPTVKKEMPVVVKEVVKPVRESTTPSSNKSNGGFFKAMYNDQANAGSPANETGTAAVFKSTSGWEDGKYYCLHNTAAPGTVVKITNASTGKTIYAKVLDAMPDIKQNADVLLRLSNAAANELGAGDKFECSISFSK
jgi:LysM repeat protein